MLSGALVELEVPLVDGEEPDDVPDPEPVEPELVWVGVDSYDSTEVGRLVGMVTDSAEVVRRELVPGTLTAAGREDALPRAAEDVLALHADFRVLLLTAASVLLENGAVVGMALAGAEVTTAGLDVTTPAAALVATAEEATAVAETTPCEAETAPEYKAGPGTTYEAIAA